MTENDRLEVFKAQTENVRYLDKVWKHLNRSINEAYRKDDYSAIQINLKLLIQVYCAFAEAIFSKTLHTPNGLSIDEINQSKLIANNTGISNGWKKCFSLAIQKVDGQKSNHKPNLIQKMNSLIDTYVFEPHLLRNKIAHGQWKKALNRDNTKINEDITLQIELIDIIILYRYKEALKSVYTILEDLIESPNKAHRKFYWSLISEFEKSQLELSTWTIANKIAKIKEKIRHKDKK